MMCEHELCSCDDARIERDGKRFCSEDCAIEVATHRHLAECHCGHPGCEVVSREIGPVPVI